MKNETKNELITEGWVDVDDKLPEKSMKVQWLCEDGKIDYGFYYHESKQFATWDLISEKPITHWMPFPERGGN
jgi:hypothetical protein